MTCRSAVVKRVVLGIALIRPAANAADLTDYLPLGLLGMANLGLDMAIDRTIPSDMHTGHNMEPPKPRAPPPPKHEVVTDDWVAQRFTGMLGQTHVKKDDKEWGMMMAEDFQCEACQHILVDAMNKVSRHPPDADEIIDALDGEVNEDRMAKAMNKEERIVAKSWVGCNMNFKESLLMKAWSLRECLMWDETLDREKGDTGAKGWCLWQNETKAAEGGLSEAEVNLYSRDRVAMWYACENTLGKHGDKAAKVLAKALKKKAEKNSDETLEDLALKACERIKCSKRRNSVNLVERSKWTKVWLERKKKEAEEQKKGKTSRMQIFGDNGEL